MQLANTLVPVATSPQMPFKQHQDNATRLKAEKNADNKLPSVALHTVTGELLENPAGLSDVSARVLQQQQIVSGYVITPGMSLTAKRAIASYASNTLSESGDSARRIGGIDIIV